MSIIAHKILMHINYLIFLISYYDQKYIKTLNESVILTQYAIH